MGTFSLWHWMVVLLIVVLVFGTKKLKNLGADLGGAVKGFKDGMKDGVASGGAQGDGGAAAQQVGRDAPGETIDVQARQKEQA